MLLANIAEDDPAHQGVAAAPVTVERPGAEPPVVVCFPFGGGIVGGSHISAVKLIQSLDRDMFRPMVVVHGDAGQVGTLLRDEAVAHEAAPSPRHFSLDPNRSRIGNLVGHIRAVTAQAVLPGFLRARNVRIVHTNDGAMHATWALPARLAGARLLWHHRSDPDGRGLRRLAPLLAHKVVGVSHYALSAHNRRFPDNPATVVYSPFDTDIRVDRDAARQRLVDELGISPDTVVVGYFGNFVARKRPVAFVDAMAAALRRSPGRPIIGLVFGNPILDGLERAMLQRAHDQGIASRIVPMGFRYPSADWLAACDILAVTAVAEPFGRTLIEAMLLGTAVVAVDTGGNSEAIRHGETGVLTAVDDADAMADGISSLIDDPGLWNRITRTAQQEARIKFGCEAHRQGIEAVYRQLLR